MGFLKKKVKEEEIQDEAENFDDDDWDDDEEEEEEAKPAKMVSRPTTQAKQVAKIKEEINAPAPTEKRKAVAFEQPAVQGLMWSDSKELIGTDVLSLLGNVITRLERIERKLD